MVNKDRRAAVMVIHGPNLNLLGRREPNIYGHGTLDELNKKIAETAQRLNIRVEIRQSNHEGEIIDLIQAAGGEFDGLIINAAAFTHYSLYQIFINGKTSAGSRLSPRLLGGRSPVLVRKVICWPCGPP